MLTPPPPPPHMIQPSMLCKQWIMGGGQAQMQAPISPKFQKSQQLQPRTPHRCKDLRNFGEIRAWRGFRISGFATLGNFEPGDVLATSAISPKFVKLEVRKHRQAPISPKFPKSQQLRPHTPHRCQEFRNLGEIRAWRCLGNLGCENTARLEFPKIPET